MTAVFISSSRTKVCVTCWGFCSTAVACHRVFQALICRSALSSSSLFQPCLDPWAELCSQTCWSFTQHRINTSLLLRVRVRVLGSGLRFPASAICHCASIFCLMLALHSDVENIPVGSLTGTPPPPFLPPTHTSTTSDTQISFSSTSYVLLKLIWVMLPPNILKKSSSFELKSAILNKTWGNPASSGPSVASPSTMPAEQSIRLTIIWSKAIYDQCIRSLL